METPFLDLELPPPPFPTQKNSWRTQKAVFVLFLFLTDDNQNVSHKNNATQVP